MCELVVGRYCIHLELSTLGKCMALWGEPNYEPSIQPHINILMQYVDN